MRTFYTLAFIVIAGASIIPTNNARQVPTTDLSTNSAYSTCARESKVDSVVLDKIFINTRFPNPSLEYDVPREAYCFVTCILHNSDDGLDGSTIHEHVLNEIEQASLDRFDYLPYTRQELLSLVNECGSKGLNDCDYLKCIKYLESPMFTFLLGNNGINEVYNELNKLSN